MAEESVTEPSSDSEKSKTHSRLILALGVLGGLVVILLLVIAVGVGYLMNSGSAPPAPAIEEETAALDSMTEAAAGEKRGEPIFLTLKPTFTANFQVGDQQHFLQIEIDLMARDKSVIEAAEKLSPMIRHRILEILSTQDGSIYTQEGKDALRRAILKALQQVVQTPAGTLEEVFFTSFVIQ